MQCLDQTFHGHHPRALDQHQVALVELHQDLVVEVGAGAHLHFVRVDLAGAGLDRARRGRFGVARLSRLLGVLAGLVLGGVQALSRSLYGSMIPEEASAEFFGFYSVFSKFSAIFGPLIFAAVDIATGSARLSILFLTAFFVIGGTLLSLVDVDAARASRNEWFFDEPPSPQEQEAGNASP